MCFTIIKNNKVNDALAKMREITEGEKWTVLLENDLPDLYL